MTLSDGDDGQPSYLPGEIAIQRINNKVLGFPEETAPILTPQKDCQVLAFGTLEALLTNIRRYNEAFETIQSVPQIDDTKSINPAFRSLIAAGKDIQTLGAYLRRVQLLDEAWHSSPGVQLLLNPDASTDLASIAIEARDKRKNELEKEREEAARNKAIYRMTERARREELEKAIREGINLMMSIHTLGREAESNMVTDGLTEAENELTREIQNSSQPTTVEDLKSVDEPLISAKENRARKATQAASFKLKGDNPSSSVVVEVPSPESLINK
ncbi:hypothetical protein PISL3812_04357 [Talaromyces islandicus]|uniref:Uncharacterized protein n=1 Tax=Talaromyces islandicus TaxID=28573 RepID=A0A0U1LXL1_TALIS|nr:hypothetical protein PISL3812_04357 [Talaromyces islandicus]